MITSTFADLVPPDSGTSYEGQIGRADFSDQVASNFLVLRSTPPWDLGGSIASGITASGWTKVPGAREYNMSAERHDGLTIDLVLWRWVNASGTAVACRFVDEDGAVYAEMITSALDRTPTRQVLAVSTLPLTDKWCWLEARAIAASGAASPVYAYGYLRMR